jgi:hypothetical protein
VKYGAALVGGAAHPATFVRVYDICGPTYPGEFDARTGAYTLHYPGVAFWFPIPPAHAQRCRESQVLLLLACFGTLRCCGPPTAQCVRMHASRLAQLKDSVSQCCGWG